MRFAGWHIDGFGIFQGHEVHDIPPGLTVFVGPNEAGKTTLLAFIRQILFGFPNDTTGRERAYPPLRGGRHGGRLRLIGPDDAHSYTVERGQNLITSADDQSDQVLVTLPDGEFGGEAALSELLGGCDRRLFQNVFAFSLTELQDFATLDADGVHDRIFSAGIVGAGRSAGDALRRLEARQAALLKPSGGPGRRGVYGGARLNDLRLQLDEVERRLKQARAQAAGYPEALQREREHAAEVERLAREIDEARAEQARYRKLQEVWPIWYRRRDAERELARLEPVESVPERAEARLAELMPAIETAERQRDEIATEVQAARERRDALVPDAAAEAHADEVHQFYDTLTLYRDRLVQLPTASGHCRKARQALDDALRDLGSEWDRARLSRFDRSIPKREEVRGFADALEQAEAAVARAEAEARQAEEARAALIQRRDALRDALAAQTPPSSEELERQDTAIRRLRAAAAEAAALDVRIRMGKETLLQLEALRERVSQPESGLARTQVRILLWVAALLLGGGAVVVQNAIASPLLALLAVGVAVFAVLVGRDVAPGEPVDDRVQGSFLEQRQRARDDLAALRERRKELSATIAAEAALLDLKGEPDGAAVEAAAEQVARRHEARERLLATEQEIAELDRQLRGHDSAGPITQAAASDVATALERARDAWADWKRQAGVPGELTPSGVLDFFESIRLAREVLREVEAAEAELRRLGQFVAAFEERAAELIAALDGTPRGERQLQPLRGLELVTEIERLRERVERDRELRRRRAGLDDELTRQALRLEVVRHDLDDLLRRREALFATAGAHDEPSFRRRLEIYALRQERLAIIRDCDQRLAEQLGEGPQAEQARRQLATGDLDAWGRAADEAGRQMVLLSEQRDRTIAARRDAETARRVLEESTAIADLELERAGLLDEHAEALRQWRVAALAEGLIAETLARFERERQPEVLAHAARLFAQITAGQYTRLVQRERGLIVIDRDGAGRVPEALSRGTAEQLYLCLRLALAGEFSRRAAALPLVMDDVLVNFDPERARRVAEVLVAFAAGQTEQPIDVARADRASQANYMQHREYAESGHAEHAEQNGHARRPESVLRQVLLFTCHPETVALLRDVAPGCGHYIMERYGGEVRAVPAGVSVG